MKILVPVDGSPCSDAALAFVAARPFEEGKSPRIDLLNVQLPVPPRAGRAVGAEVLRAWYEAESRKVLKPAIAALRQAGLDPAWFRAVGNPGIEIAEWAEAHEVDLIVMGSHGHTAIAGLVFGSVAQKVLASTAIPVLALRGPRAPRRSSLRLCIALDGSEYGTAAARYVIAHRAFFGRHPSITLVNVAEGGAHAESKAVLAPAHALFAEAGIEAGLQSLVGHTGAELARYARKARPDVLVMGSHGRGALTSALLGSVAWRVAATCTTPLLLIRKR